MRNRDLRKLCLKFLTLAILAGFVVVLAFQSYDTSRSGAEAEARIVAHQLETVQFLPAPVRARLSGELVCASRRAHQAERMHRRYDRRRPRHGV